MSFQVDKWEKNGTENSQKKKYKGNQMCVKEGVSFCQNIADKNAVKLTFSYIFDGFVNYTTF